MSLSVSILVPVYNNASTVDELHRRLVETLEAMDRSFEIVFVNDGSADASIVALRKIAEQDPRCVVLNLSRNFGQHPAISAGLARANGDITVLMDADLQDRPEELPRLLQPFDDDPEVDIVYTTFQMESGKRTKVTSRVFHALFARLSDVHIPPNLGTYRAFSSSVRDALLDYPERSAVYGPLMAQMGFSNVYVQVARDEAAGRTSSYTFRRRLALAMSSIISYGSFLHRFVTWIGFSLTLPRIWWS
jgi:polyisoprenyl-phosphate glycosyltransferase